MEKSWKFQGCGGVTRSPLERKIQWGGGQTGKKPSVGGYGYFLEPYNRAENYKADASSIVGFVWHA